MFFCLMVIGTGEQKMTRHQNREIGAREATVWMLGLCCGVWVSAVDDAATLPGRAVLALAFGPPVAAWLLRRLLRPRRRAVVWEESRGRAPGDASSPGLASGNVSPLV
jgi:hypothetical protein